MVNIFIVITSLFCVYYTYAFLMSKERRSTLETILPTIIGAIIPFMWGVILMISGVGLNGYLNYVLTVSILITVSAFLPKMEPIPMVLGILYIIADILLKINFC